MSAYSVLTYLDTFKPTASEMNAARPLTFSQTDASFQKLGYENEAKYSESGSGAILRDLFKINLIEGAKYYIYSSSYFDPFLLSLHDKYGSFIAVDSGSSYGSDTLFYTAPYSGVYYVNASWNQGSYYKFVYLSVLEDTDVAVPKNSPPAIASSMVDQNWTEDAPFHYTVPAGTFTDPDGNNLSYSAKLISGSPLPSWLNFNTTTHDFTGTAPFSSPDYTVRVTVTDTGGLSTYDDVVFVTVPAPVIDRTAPAISSFSPAAKATGIAVASNIAITFNETIARGTGNFVLKTLGGLTVATYDAATSRNLSVSGNTLTINPAKDLDIFTSYKLEIGAGAVKDLAGNTNVAASDYNFTTETPDSLYHFFVVAFNAAPGVVYLGQVAEAYNSGMTVSDIVNVYVTKHQFTDTYPTTQSHSQLATALVGNIVKSSATDLVKAGAIADITGALDAGWSVGRTIYQVFGNLATKPLSDPDWGGTAQQLINQTAVARYYTETMGAGGDDLTTLRAVIGSVDNYTDVSTPELIATLIGVELAALH